MNIGFGEDLLTDILSRLPVKCLLRFRCVCKFWYALLKSPHFITNHLQCNHPTLIEGNAPLVCIKDQAVYDYETRSCTYKTILSWISSSSDFINDDEIRTVVQVPSINPNPFTDGETSPLTFIMGPVNGLYFTASNQETGTLYLCNPALREVRVIPNVPSPPPMTENPFETQFDNTFGFGYDSKANDYKVLAIQFVWSWVKEGRSYHVFLYSLRSNSWRKIECDYFKSLSDRPIEATFVNHGNGRVAHWLTIDDGDENGCQILSFDFVDQLFRRSSLPEALDDKQRGYAGMVNGRHMLPKNYDIGVLKDESIALIIRLPPPLGEVEFNQNGHRWEVWVMKEYGVRESWTKLFATGYLPELFPFKRFANNDREILFMNHKNNHLVSYDPYRQKTKDLHININGARIRNYMESLVSIITGGY